MGTTAIIAGSIAGAALLGGGAYAGKKYYNHYKFQIMGHSLISPHTKTNITNINP